ncbi:MAG: prepilin-type N-terminal cleavage/methylation domain-containing protein [Patescibacteria group bacterium]|nr:prepilin-type N-terminal cleavage/methylation domain-containing protein [Patescibacteria group bacterium]
MPLHNKNGFTLVEVMVSVAVIGLLAVIMMTSLGSTRQTEELKASARQLAADIRSMQARALAAGDVQACPNSSSLLSICEDSTAACTNPADCVAHVPSAFGVNASSSATYYTLFAEVEPSTADFHLTRPTEVLLSRPLLQGTSQNVVIKNVLTGKPAPLLSKTAGDVSFMRQSGNTRLNDGSGLEPDIMVFRLWHKVSSSTVDVEVNRVTGRVSVL